MSKQARGRLRELRNVLGLTQEEVASNAGMTKQHYSLVENGKGGAQPEKMAKINTFFRRRRQEKVQELQEHVKYLQSLKIDEKLFLKGPAK